MTLTARRHADLLVLCVLAALCTLGVVVVPVLAVKVVLAVPLCLVIPGYALALAIFARAQLELTARLMLSSALSLMTCVLGGMLLDELPGGITKTSWAIFLLIFTVVVAGFAWYRRSDGVFGAGPPVIWRIPSVRPASVITVILAVLIGVGALYAARIPLSAKLANGYENLSLDSVNGGRDVRVELLSVRQHTASYQLKVSLDHKVVLTRSIANVKPGAGVNLLVPVGRSATQRQFRATVVLTPGKWIARVVQLRLPPSS